jgi:hypothetical protein
LLLPYEKERATSSRTVVPWLPASRGFAWSGGNSAEKMTSVDDSAREPSFLETFAEEPREDWDREDWHPEDATVEIWSAESAEPVDMLGSVAREPDSFPLYSNRRQAQALCPSRRRNARARNRAGSC